MRETEGQQGMLIPETKPIPPKHGGRCVHCRQLIVA